MTHYQQEINRYSLAPLCLSVSGHHPGDNDDTDSNATDSPLDLSAKNSPVSPRYNTDDLRSLQKSLGETNARRVRNLPLPFQLYLNSVLGQIEQPMMSIASGMHAFVPSPPQHSFFSNVPNETLPPVTKPQSPHSQNFFPQPTTVIDDSVNQKLEIKHSKLRGLQRRNDQKFLHLEELAFLIENRLKAQVRSKFVSLCLLCGASSSSDNKKIYSCFMRKHLYTHVQNLYKCALCRSYDSNAMSRVRDHARKMHGVAPTSTAEDVVIDARCTMDVPLRELARKCFGAVPADVEEISMQVSMSSTEQQPAPKRIKLDVQ